MRKRTVFTIASLLALVLIAALAGATGASPVSDSTAGQTYIVLYRAQAVPANAAATISAAGGALIHSYPQIGVAIASSADSSFAATLSKNALVEGVSATAGFATRIDGAAADEGTMAADIPAPGDDPLSGLQWDMRQIRAPEARAVTGGSPSILVGDIDTGMDFTHPDLAPNVDFANSVSCVGGVPNTNPAAWMDDNGHGTHTAGTIAAARNGIGIVGVAPNVRIAAIKAGNAAGFFYPEAVVCAFMWAGTHGMQVTNNSYFADPWLFNCRNDAGQRAIWKAEQRAIQFAQSRGVLVVASAGNQSDDLAHPTADATSPDNTDPVLRQIHNECLVIPAEIAGVVTVSATGDLRLKSFYSSYGIGVVDVTAPGGDSVLQRTATAPNGRVLSTWPATQPCGRLVVDGGARYCYLQGTSMAGPHVAGVAALIASQGVASPGAVSGRLTNTAEPLACPADMSIYAPFPAVDGGTPQVCQGGEAYNSFYGHGLVDALAAVSR